MLLTNILIMLYSVIPSKRPDSILNCRRKNLTDDLHELRKSGKGGTKRTFQEYMLQIEIEGLNRRLEQKKEMFQELETLIEDLNISAREKNKEKQTQIREKIRVLQEEIDS